VNISIWPEPWRLPLLLILDSSHNMNRFMSLTLLLFSAIKLAQASQWDDGYDADILGDSPGPLITPAPIGGYHEALLRQSFGLPPLNATVGGGSDFHRLVSRQEVNYI
jgi:hypothetical protein